MATTRKRPAKDPSGGLTAKGRKHFKETEGANLRPGVKQVKSAEDARRKGSFLRRHYGRKNPSPLTDEHGEPTRYAKQAHAWGEPVPKTAADVKKLAKKGTDLLDRYHAETDAKAGTKPPARASGESRRRAASGQSKSRPTAKSPGSARS